MIEPSELPLQETFVPRKVNPVITVAGSITIVTLKSQVVNTSLTLITCVPGATLLNTAGVVFMLTPPSKVYL